MPFYEYRCPGNGRTVEVRHAMSETLTTWGEVCARSGAEPGDTPAGAPVERLMSAPVALTTTTGGGAPVPSCGAGCACAMDA